MRAQGRLIRTVLRNYRMTAVSIGAERSEDIFSMFLAGVYLAVDVTLLPVYRGPTESLVPADSERSGEARVVSKNAASSC